MVSKLQLLLILQSFLLGNAFRVQRQQRRRSQYSSLFSAGSSNSEEQLPLLGDLEESCLSVGVAETRAESAILWEALKARKESLDQGIGKRYVCRTREGFLNVHKEPGDVYNEHNVVRQLKDGDIVISKGPPRGVGGWIQHDQGGWSVMMYRGFTFLELIEE